VVEVVEVAGRRASKRLRERAEVAEGGREGDVGAAADVGAIEEVEAAGSAEAGRGAGRRASKRLRERAEVAEGREATEARSPVSKGAAQCVICQECPDAGGLARLSGCAHEFCGGCIGRWAQVSTTCPLCKARFEWIEDVGAGTRAAVERKDQAWVDQEEDAAVTQELHDEELRRAAEGYEAAVARDADDDTGCMVCSGRGDDHLYLLCDSCNQGAHTYCVRLGHSVPLEAGFGGDCAPARDDYSDTVCMVCNGRGDDDLCLLCDACDQGAHTYCVGLGRSVPRGDWFCGDCAPARRGGSGSGAAAAVGRAGASGGSSRGSRRREGGLNEASSLECRPVGMGHQPGDGYEADV